MKNTIVACVMTFFFFGTTSHEARAQAQQAEPENKEFQQSVDGSKIQSPLDIDETVQSQLTFNYLLAVEDALHVLYSSVAKSSIAKCIDDWIAKPGELTLVLEINPQGHAKQIKDVRGLPKIVTACLETDISKINFKKTPKGFQVGARYTLGKDSVRPVTIAEPAKAAAPTKKIKKETMKDPAAGRLVYTQTAFTLPKKGFDFTAVDGGNFFFTYGISDNLNLTINTIPPIMIWGVGLFLKTAFQLAPKVRLGFIFNFGFLWPFIFEKINYEKDDIRHTIGFMYGGAPLVLTIGDENMFFNISLHLEGISCKIWGMYRRESTSDSESHFFAFPSIGGSFKIARRVKINFQIWTLLTSMAAGKDGLHGRLWGIMPGLRFFWEKAYIDTSVIIVIAPFLEYDEGGMEHMEMMPPIVGPMITFGFQN